MNLYQQLDQQQEFIHNDHSTKIGPWQSHQITKKQSPKKKKPPKNKPKHSLQTKVYIRPNQVFIKKQNSIVLPKLQVETKHKYKKMQDQLKLELIKQFLNKKKQRQLPSSLQLSLNFENKFIGLPINRKKQQMHISKQKKRKLINNDIKNSSLAQLLNQDISIFSQKPFTQRYNQQKERKMYFESQKTIQKHGKINSFQELANKQITKSPFQGQLKIQYIKLPTKEIKNSYKRRKNYI